MRIALLPAAVALALAAVPASADPVIQTCGSGDYTVARVEVANVEVAHVCTDRDPLGPIYLPGCNICPPLPPSSGR